MARPDDDANDGGPHTSADDPLAVALLEQIQSLLRRLHTAPTVTVTLDSDLARDLGADSLALVELLEQLEQSFAVEIPDEVFASA